MAKQKSPAYVITADILTARPDASFDECKTAVESGGHTLAPVVYGLCKKNLGLVDPSQVGVPKKPPAMNEDGTPKKRRGRPPGSKNKKKAVDSDSVPSVPERAPQWVPPYKSNSQLVSDDSEVYSESAVSEMIKAIETLVEAIDICDSCSSGLDLVNVRDVANARFGDLENLMMAIQRLNGTGS